MNNRTIFNGDTLTEIKKIKNESIDTIITSPPYWALRDYTTGRWTGGNNPACTHDSIRRKTRKERGGLTALQAGSKGSFGNERQFKLDRCPDCDATYEDQQLGKEPDYNDYLSYLRKLMAECHRILKQTGTVWINLGDTYAGSHKGAGGDPKKCKESFTFDKAPKTKIDITAKSLIGIPQRFYIQCIDDGWIARNYIPWVKINHMPSPVTDRFTNSWESIFFFSKSKKYYFNINAVREKSQPVKEGLKHSEIPHQQLTLESKKLEIELPINKLRKGYGGNNKALNNNQFSAKKRPGAKTTATINPAQDKDIKTMQHPRKDLSHRKFHTQTMSKKTSGNIDINTGLSINHPLGKNPGNVFHMNTRPYKEAHFALFPIDLPMKILKAACPKSVCRQCQKPREPISSYDINAEFSKCDCGAGWESGTVLDPFFGGGTTGLAAEKLGLRWVGIELNPDYIKIARKRLNAYRNKNMDMMF